ncbi:MAG: stress response translation initiation inhibitor YciH [Spirochaetes bacterium]|nr:stress response translation initiation inhibitor YciH [Spirochaetota bacterium]
MSDKIVYSTESGDLRKKPRSGAGQAARRRDGIVRVRKERAGRGGKTVSVIQGLDLPEDRLTLLAARLKQQCGAGGTVKNGEIIIQGDKVAFIAGVLQKEGFTVRVSGAS